MVAEGGSSRIGVLTIGRWYLGGRGAHIHILEFWKSSGGAALMLSCYPTG